MLLDLRRAFQARVLAFRRTNQSSDLVLSFNEVLQRTYRMSIAIVDCKLRKNRKCLSEENVFLRRETPANRFHDVTIPWTNRDPFEKKKLNMAAGLSNATLVSRDNYSAFLHRVLRARGYATKS